MPALFVIAFIIVAVVHFLRAPNWKEAVRRERAARRRPDAPGEREAPRR